MAKVLWVVLAVAVVCFVSCSKEGPAGPAGSAGTQGSTGATGAPGTPRKMYIERVTQAENGMNGWHLWSYTTTLPWTPAANGVVVNFRGFWLNQSYGGFASTYAQSVSGNTVTVFGEVSSETGPYDYEVYFDIVAYDTFNTVFVNDKTSGMKKRPMPVAQATSKKDLP